MLAESHYDSAAESLLNDLEFHGHSLSDWSVKLTLQIGNPEDFSDLKELQIELAKKIQMATYYYSISSTVFNVLDSSTHAEKGAVTQAILDEFRERGEHRPTQASMDAIVRGRLQSINNQKLSASIVKNFFKQRLDTLIEIRKILESLSISMSMERKLNADY